MELIYKSKVGCPVISKGQVTSFVDNNKLLIGIGLIVLGAALAFAGRTLLVFVNFIISFAAIALFISYFGLLITEKSYG